MKPVVTIGMCLHNSEHFLRDAVDSIIKQDFPHKQMQIIFVDDGSEDHTLQIIRDYASRMDIKTKVFHTNWQGLGSARNLVVNNADGEYIVWVDADEILSENYVKKQVEFMIKNPEVGITAGLFKTVPKNLILNLELIPAIINHMNYERPKSFIWKTEKLPGTGGSTFRIEALKQVNGFDERLKGVGEDQDLAQRIRNAGWLIRFNDAEFCELHNGMSKFKDLWTKYIWYGYGCQKIYRKNRKVFSFLRMSPPAGFITGLIYSLTAYRLLYQKRVFLLPLHFSLKMMGWMLGFIKSQIDSRKE